MLVMDNYLKDKPLAFELNQGQYDQAVKYIARGKNYNAFFTDDELVMVIQQPANNEKNSEEYKKYNMEQKSSIVRIKLLGSNKEPSISGLNKLSSQVNYFLDNKSEEWQTNIPVYSQIKYENIYPDIDMLFYGKEEQLEFDFIVNPGANYDDINIEFSGCQKLDVNESGDLVLILSGIELCLKKPVIYQLVNGRKKEISCSYELNEKRLKFKIEDYDLENSLIIDPVIMCTSIYSGSQADYFSAIDLDLEGNIYITGTTYSSDFPVEDSIYQFVEPAAFVIKINGKDSEVIYSTFLGKCYGEDLAVDDAGNVFL